MTNFQKNVGFLLAVGGTVWLVRAYGHIKYSMGYMEGATVVSKAFIDKKIEEEKKEDNN